MSAKSVVVSLLFAIHVICADYVTIDEFTEDGEQNEINLDSNEFMIITDADWALKPGYTKYHSDETKRSELNRLQGRSQEITHQLKADCDQKNYCKISLQMLDLSNNMTTDDHKSMIDFVVTYQRRRYCPQIKTEREVHNNSPPKIPLSLATSLDAKSLAVLTQSNQQLMRLPHPDWQDFMFSRILSFVYNTPSFAGCKSKNFLFNDGSYLLNFQSWCDFNNSMSTALNNIKAPSGFLPRPPSAHPLLQRCSVGIFTSAIGDVEAIFTVHDHPLRIHPLKIIEHLDTFDRFAFTANLRFGSDVSTRIANEDEQADPMRTTFTYDHNIRHLLVEGENVNLNDVVEHENFANASTIDVFALDQIVINANVSKIGEKATLAFIAPRWTVSELPVGITLDGVNGQNYSTPAHDAIGNEVKGDDGKPGLAGVSAGHFFGAGIAFENLNLLSIRAVGGQGGPGQPGGKGSRGVSGEDAFINIHLHEHDPLETGRKFEYGCSDLQHIPGWFSSNDIMNCTIYGKNVKVKPGDGGNGGIGGLGGNGGQIKLFGATTEPHQNSKCGELSL